jgi:hypothetical protein
MQSNMTKLTDHSGQSSNKRRIGLHCHLHSSCLNLRLGYIATELKRYTRWNWRFGDEFDILEQGFSCSSFEVGFQFVS